MGCILYELATGDKPFKTDWAVIKYHEIYNIHNLPHKTLVANGHRSLSMLVHNMFERDPSLRPAARDLDQTFRWNFEFATEAENPTIINLMKTITTTVHVHAPDNTRPYVKCARCLEYVRCGSVCATCAYQN